MYPFMRVTIGVVVTCFAVILVQNLSGFWVSPQDGPEFKTAVADGAAAGGEAASGPGANLFKANCASCHQPSGKGIPGTYPTLAGSAFAQGDPTVPIRIVLHGFQGKIERNGTTINGVMPQLGSVLSDEDIANILTYVRSSWGNSADAVDAATVADVRAKTAGHAPYVEADLQQAL